MKIKNEEREIVFEFKNAEEHNHFVKILEQTNKELYLRGRSSMCWACCSLAKIRTKDGLDLCDVIDTMIINCSE